MPYIGLVDPDTCEEIKGEGYSRIDLSFVPWGFSEPNEVRDDGNTDFRVVNTKPITFVATGPWPPSRLALYRYIEDTVPVCVDPRPPLGRVLPPGRLIFEAGAVVFSVSNSQWRKPPLELEKVPGPPGIMKRLAIK